MKIPDSRSDTPRRFDVSGRRFDPETVILFGILGALAGCDIEPDTAA
jgi:hypothetical protein